jgi:cytochrome c oxidase cbb3-type subunit III
MASDHTKPHIDAKTGVATTGHEWDGVRELNMPLPRWWLWLFYITIVWSVGYWIVYPTWPLITSFSQGTFGWSSRGDVSEELDRLRTLRAPTMNKLAAASAGEIAADPQLSDFARALSKPVFAENCAPCHGSGGGGAKGYPNLNDDDWLWGGKLDDLVLTIRHGIRAADDKTRQGSMPAFGRDGMLKAPEISAVADFVRTLAKLPVTNANTTLGAKLFAENCAVCHGNDGKGKRDLGAPDLTDAIWLFGSDKTAIMEGITNGRGSVMPAWGERLDDTTIKALAVYIHGLGGGEK